MNGGCVMTMMSLMVCPAHPVTASRPRLDTGGCFSVSVRVSCAAAAPLGRLTAKQASANR